VSSHLSLEITRLAADARRHRIHCHGLIKELTMIVGYAHMLEVHPQSRNIVALRKHLQAFTDLGCAHEYSELCQHALKIIELIGIDW
jgi:hypothetical protein